MEEPRDIRDYMIGLRFPASKEQVITFVREHGGSRFVLLLLARIPEQVYRSPDDVTAEITTID